MEGTRKIRKN